MIVLGDQGRKGVEDGASAAACLMSVGWLRSSYLPFLIAAVGLDRRQNQTFAATHPFKPDDRLIYYCATGEEMPLYEPCRNAHRAFVRTLGSEAVWLDYFTRKRAVA